MSNQGSSTSNQSFRNSADDFLTDALGGFVAAHPNLQWHDEGFIGRGDAIVASSGKPAVAIVSGGGSGHEPLHAGFVGAGMLSAVCPGLLFTSPNAVQITEATRWADQGAGVLHIVKNYTGDIMNFTVARQALAETNTAVVVVADDVATEIDEDGPGSRGTGATVIVEKIAGAAAQRGDSLAEVAQVAQDAADNSRSMAVALAPGFLPTTGRDTFDLPADSMELGVGIHGERGVSRKQTESAGQIVDRLLTDIVEALDLRADEQVICLVNNLGGTTDLELNLVYGTVLQWLAHRKIVVARALVGTFVTSLNMAGVSITLTRFKKEFAELLDADTDAPAWPRQLIHNPTYLAAATRFDDAMPSDGETNRWLSDAIARIQGATDDLTELDRLAGDGDFGANMEAAFGGIELPVRGSDSDVLRGISTRLFIRAGGTSGAVLGTLFRELADAMADANDNAIADGFASGLERAHTVITELGGAQQGDNTVIDALVPAAEAARASADENPEDLNAAQDAAYTAAERGALGTGELVAKKGRASYLGDASAGVADPGAIVVSWLFGGTGNVSDFTE